MSFIILILMLSSLRVDAYSTGAPNQACNAMVPGHGREIQKSPPPYLLTLNATETFGGGSLVFKLESHPDSFKGFFIQGRDLATDKPVGTFHSRDHSVVSCASGTNNAITHKDPEEKNSVTVEWTAPTDYEGQVQFRATVVKNYVTYWTGLTSETVSVAKRSVAGRSSIPRPTTGTTGVADLYEGCGKTKKCFGPDNCDQQKNCRFMVTYTDAGNHQYEFELITHYSDPNSYVAVGLSEDSIMGSDSVVACSSVNEVLNVLNSWNDGKSNKPVSNAKEGLTIVEMHQGDGELYCKFHRDAKTIIQNKHFDLSSENYHVMVAQGLCDPAGKLLYHQKNKIVSAEKVFLGETFKMDQRPIAFPHDEKVPHSNSVKTKLTFKLFCIAVCISVISILI